MTKRSAQDKDTPHKHRNGSKDGLSQAQTSVHGHTMPRADVFKFVGLIAFLAIMIAIVVLLWPYLSDIFSEGGVGRLVERVKSAGPVGVFMLLGLQLLQVIVAFIPGEAVQLAAGLMYGPWIGALIVFVGCVLSTMLVYKLVHALGAPFVQSMVSTEHLKKFRHFEETGKLDAVVFVLFLIPGLPKDVFTYLVPLTRMPMMRFVALANVARIPGILASTFFAHGLSKGNWAAAIVIAVIVGIIVLLAVIFHKRLFDFLARHSYDAGSAELSDSDEV